MVGELITLPLRVTRRIARLSWRAAERTARLSRDVAGYVTDQVSSGRSDGDPSQLWSEAPGGDLIRPVSPASPTRPVSPPNEASTPERWSPTEGPAAATHVSEEPELVEEFAEPGVEEGAGAEIHVREPWEGYRQMNARDVTARLSSSSPAELAAIQLYESSTRGRQTILSAVTRHLRSATGNGSRA